MSLLFCGLYWLLGEIWPAVAAALPKVQLHLAGHRLPAHLKGERVVALGSVQDLDAILAPHGCSSLLPGTVRPWPTKSDLSFES